SIALLAALIVLFVPGIAGISAQDTQPAETEQPPPELKPTPQQVDQALKDFDSKYRTQIAEDRVLAVETLIGVKDPRVTKTLCNVLKGDRETTVQIAALKVLVQHKDPNAVPVLTSIFDDCKEDKITLAIEICQALGAFADPRAVKSLSSDLWRINERNVIRARIQALGEIRDKSSIDALIRMMWSKHRKNGMVQFDAIRDALKKLTHLDFGGNRTDWQNWWSKNKNSFQVPKDPPPSKTKNNPKQPDGTDEVPPPELPPEEPPVEEPPGPPEGD
ncbi:MAG: HEAT repeat domain-containing protein, partial [Planctomycetota bacterium]|nr:HEAT repeat domain-containing protein [Planctomycetota bacterium]